MWVCVHRLHHVQLQRLALATRRLASSALVPPSRSVCSEAAEAWSGMLAALLGDTGVTAIHSLELALMRPSHSLTHSCAPGRQGSLVAADGRNTDEGRKTYGR
eukprot:CAMPEP_0206507816 /NCGR_PEP_ID=MMETSP0324_2-20121206/57824_1 /ASSEMBLY_ACC=CAM_ASM_000836 /TAXON_ID=2866 /ORGANISM="Crypthecodinium cohnii, Strain Seligo" /LENGTH=102 /DNA_ID=CAMNT_0053998285 /DNA_START=432 /DNA_END=736 /DNA_ORIENTATION=-